jgi:hypothetical protein
VTPTAALLRFHFGAGVRLAMRAGLPAAALLTVAIGLSGAADAILAWAAADLAGTAGSLATPLLLAAIGAGIATWCAPRVGHGIEGWVRHLPAAAAEHGLGLTGALMAAQAPIAAAWIVLWVVAWTSGVAVDPRRLLALPVVLAGIACALLPGRRPVLFAVAGVATVALALRGGWIGIACGLPLVFAATRFFEPARQRGTAISQGHRTLRARRIPGIIASRAVGWRVLGAWVPALVLLGVGALIVENNPEFDTSKPLRLVGTLAVGIVVGGLADPLAIRRPPWRWARSLPWSAADRVRHDAMWFAVRAGGVPLAFGLLDPAAGLATALTVPLLTFRGAAMLRQQRGSIGGPSRVVMESFFLGLCMILSSWVALVALMLAWPAWAAAARRDRDLDVSRWSPRDHLAIGDPGSWRGG